MCEKTMVFGRKEGIYDVGRHVSEIHPSASLSKHVSNLASVRSQNYGRLCECSSGIVRQKRELLLKI